ncbi:MAG: invasion associated locus B family protein [Rhodobacteraceae bacterium]|nr:invasion associated locus B family protein [Paracoccaceae bacterium]
MLKSLSPFSTLALLVALASPLAAQETEQNNDTFDLGTVVNDDGLAVGETYLREEFGDWQQTCVVTLDGNDACQLYQLLNDEDGNPVSQVSILPLPPGGQAVAGALIVVPLETQLTERLTVRIDGGEARRYEFDFCNIGGCVARFGLTAEQIAQFKRGNAASIVLVPAIAPDQQIVLQMSLTGFTAGFDAVVADFAN